MINHKEFDFEEWLFDGSVVRFLGKMLLIIFVPLIAGIMALSWFGSCKEAEIFNKFSDVQVSCSDVFWAGDSITSQNQTLKLR